MKIKQISNQQNVVSIKKSNAKKYKFQRNILLFICIIQFIIILYN
jgi:hypothetical protein